MPLRGVFREDLSFRLRRLVIAVPTLAERLEDLLTLLGHLVSQGARWIWIS